MHLLPSSLPWIVCVFALLGQCEPCAASALQVSPSSVLLESPESTQQVVILHSDETGRGIDVTRTAGIRIDPPQLAEVDERGLVRPLKNGIGFIVIQYGVESQAIPIEVRTIDDPAPVSFQNEIIPILTKSGCNSGGCHGKAEGQNGFKLSIFGFDARSDFEALALEGRGRRIFAASPQNSLLIRKATAQTPHGGGRKIEPGSARAHRLTRWISEGARFDVENDAAATVVGIEVEPLQQILLAGESLQIQVRTIDAAGHRRCVTNEAAFESNAPTIADVDSRGLVQASEIPGEAAILVRQLGHVAVMRITLPQPGVTFPRPMENSFIDKLAWNKLQALGIEPSEAADDATFLRRVFLDTIGTLPTSAEVREFLIDSSDEKRLKMIDRLLDRDEYADYWTMKWLDILRADSLAVSPQGVVATQRWLRHSFQENRPFDQMAIDLLTVQGNTSAEGPGSFYKAVTKPDETARSVSQLLLGVRIECAECHHHPSERWSQEDYVGLAGFFTGISLKSLPNGEQAIVSLGGKDLPHPRSGELVPARALGADAANFSRVTDRRRVLASWITSPENPFFATAISNRLWAHYFGRGLIEPIDDIRDTNPATNAPLMLALTEHMRDMKYDLKAFTRTLLNSELYQLSATTLPSNINDQQNFSHSLQRSLQAEVLLDAISQCTGVAEEFNGWPKGYRAIQVWDNRVPSYFFTIFGRPVRATVCECERSNEPSIAQALHLLNAPEISEKISNRHGRVRNLADSKLTPEELIDELYLSTLSRFPTLHERELMLQAFVDTDRRSAMEDVLWALLNSREFLFNH